MKCEDIKLQLPGLLFEELPAEAKEQVLSHLSECQECSKEWEELKSTRTTMAELEDDEPPFQTVYMPGTRRPVWQPILGAMKWGFAAAVVLVGLWIAKPSVSYTDGDFRLAFGGIEAEEPVGASFTDIEKRLQEERLETVMLVAQMLAQNSEEQKQNLALSFAALLRELDLRRYSDLERFELAVMDVRRSSWVERERTNMIIEDLIKAASFGQDESGRR